MNTAIRRLLSAALVPVAALAFASCKGKQAQPEEGMDTSAPVTEVDINQGVADSDSGKAFGLETIQFGYDSALLDATAKTKLTANAQILKDKADLKVQIEGHCDERGGIQYNIALGERRANAVKKFLTDRGVKGANLSIISYGKEKPLDPSATEEAWAKNRRANFRVTER